MKYEAVFGNQDLFDGAGTFTGLDVVTRSIASGNMMYCRLGDLTPESLREYPVIAMRRIIQEPKRWTVADQQAGRDPKVGCMVMVTSVDECASVAAINNDAVCVVFHDGEFTTLHKSGISPIETTAEKAQRLEDEWVNKAWGETAVFAGVTQDEHDRLRIHLRHIYRAQLSGELAAPKGGE